MKILDGYKKLITTLTSALSINYIAFLVFKDNLDGMHKIEVYTAIVVTLGALAGAHGMMQSKIDMKKALTDTIVGDKPKT